MADNRSCNLPDLVNHSCSIQASESLRSTFSQFNNSPHDFMAVLDGSRLLGICSRREIGMILGSGYGRELFGNSSVREHLEPNCLTIMDGSPMVEVLSTVFSVDDSRYFNDIVLTDRAGRYLGLISVLTMIRLQNRLLLELNLELKDSLRELEDARQAAESANKAKSEFLSNMSHEIRTPMNAVLGLAQLLEKEQLAPDQRDMVRHIRTAGHSLMGIINDILDFSKIEAGKLRIELRPFTLPALLNQLDGVMGSAARGKGLGLRIDPPAGLTSALLGDDLRLGQILINLVGNAVKFTEHGEVRVVIVPVELTETTTRLRFEVHDTGVGIAPEVMATLFKPFTQADDSITRRFGGTGLGLSICKRLVELMEGIIDLESREGGGSTFWFEVPFHLTTAVGMDFITGSVETVAGGPRLVGRRVLVVDDSDINRIIVARALALEGAQTVTANNGQQALHLLRAQPGEFDILLMDVQMPVMDGLTATRALRGDPCLCELPVIAFTAGVFQDERQRALDAGVNDFLAKPVDLEEMVAVLLRWSSPATATTDSLAKGEPTPTGSADEVRSLPAALPGLDVAKGVATCGGEKLYRELIHELMRSHGDDVAAIRCALTTGNHQQAGRIAHTLKGVAGNLSAVTIYRIADELEIALKHNQPDFVDSLLLRLTDAMAELRTAALLVGEESPSPTQILPAAPLVESCEISPLIDELLQMLQERRLAARHVVRRLGEKLSGTVVAPELTLLSVAVDRLEFVDAHTMAMELAQRFTQLKNRTAQNPPQLLQ